MTPQKVRFWRSRTPASQLAPSRRINWRWAAAALFFLCAMLGLLMGVGLTERPDVASSSLLTKAYYSLGLFVVGGLDVGMPIGGPLVGRLMLWAAYFGSPLLMASAVIEAVLRVMHPQRWKLRRLNDHIVIVGAGALTTSYLRMLRGHVGTTPIVVVDDEIDPVREEELTEAFHVTVVVGDINREFLQRELKLDRALQVVFLGDHDFLAYEAASKVLRQYPTLGSRIVLHCHNLRFLRSMADTTVAKQCTT
ncbi:MAG: NAD-binding protein, partial [Gammaproteobacteria bacterium]